MSGLQFGRAAARIMTDRVAGSRSNETGRDFGQSMLVRPRFARDINGLDVCRGAARQHRTQAQNTHINHTSTHRKSRVNVRKWPSSGRLRTHSRATVPNSLKISTTAKSTHMLNPQKEGVRSTLAADGSPPTINSRPTISAVGFPVRLGARDQAMSCEGVWRQKARWTSQGLQFSWTHRNFIGIFKDESFKNLTSRIGVAWTPLIVPDTHHKAAG
ncbi:hypothetical protein B0H19DRAFT_1055580 [Mycena capillaripes]|nr:hypothetical protein B0H19DRAFT_1055580 [Mycena capillaripes]